MKIEKVCISGGTHGDELTGVYMVKHLRDMFSNCWLEDEIEVNTILSNQRAVDLAQRYVEQDLNRCFSRNILQDSKSSTLEHLRAREIYSFHKDKDLMIDLHNTTSDMGITLITIDPNNEFIIRMIHHIHQKYPDKKIFPFVIESEGRPWTDACCVSSICPNGIGIELGPQSHRTLNWNLFKTCKNVIFDMLNFCKQVNSYGLPKDPISVRCFVTWETVDFPRNDEGEIIAAIHPDVKDYHKINKGCPIFIKFDGQVVLYEGEESFYPVFVGEAAYLEKHIAFWKTRERRVKFGDHATSR